MTHRKHLNVKIILALNYGRFRISSCKDTYDICNDIQYETCFLFIFSWFICNLFLIGRLQRVSVLNKSLCTFMRYRECCLIRFVYITQYQYSHATHNYYKWFVSSVFSLSSKSKFSVISKNALLWIWLIVYITIKITSFKLISYSRSRANSFLNQINHGFQASPNIFFLRIILYLSIKKGKITKLISSIGVIHS